jgi:hypothetical protein
MKRTVLAVLPMLAALGCATPPPGATTPREMPAVSRDGRGAICASDLQSCDRSTPCCSGLVCQPNGRFGQMCQRPWP